MKAVLLRIVQLATALLPLAAIAQTDFPNDLPPNRPQNEVIEGKYDWAARVNSGQAIAPLGDSLFGDQTSFYDGSTTFSITDIDLPGNNALPVRISRMHRASDPAGFPTSGLMGEWDLELPHLRGTFARSLGWQVATATPNQRCSVPPAFRNPPNAVSADGGVFPAAFTPNALGQSTQVGSLISATRWHPSRTNAGWTFGNGIQRALTQTSRKLPDRLTDSGSGSAAIFDEDLNYDENGNVTAITDTRDPTLNRTLSYDAQDRLTQAQGVWGSGSMTYDGADNLKTQTIGAKNYTYTYSNQKLRTISNPNQTLISFGYDAKGNQTQKNGQSLTWDQASRIASADGKAQYRYDGHGRRLLVEKLNSSNQPTGNSTLQIYSQAGQLLYEEAITSSIAGADGIFANGFERSGTTFHYLDKTLVARKEAQNSVTTTTYLHTDILGSVVAETNQSQQVIKRTNYQPFGLPSGANNGPGYTGHVMDADTSLIYMQARYFDPDVGRFLSMDPKPPIAIDGTDFNRYAHARNNPYRNVDPDGRIVETVWDVANIGIGVVSLGKNVATVNYIGAAIDAVGVVVDTAATIVPVVPAGAGVAIKAARAADAVVDKVRVIDAAKRATEIHSTLKPGTALRTTTAVTETAEGTRVVSSSERRLRPEQRSALRDGEVEGVGPGHAEATGVNAAERMGLKPTGTAASRPICPSCAGTLQERTHLDTHLFPTKRNTLRLSFSAIAVQDRSGPRRPVRCGNPTLFSSRRS